MVLSKPSKSFATTTVISQNENGGFYCCGKRYSFCDKTRVFKEFLRLSSKLGAGPSTRHLAMRTKVSRKYAGLVIKEYNNFGTIIDPKWIEKQMQAYKNFDKNVLSHQDKIFLLSLLSEDPFRNNSNYVEELQNETGKIVSDSTISRFFQVLVHTKEASENQYMCHLTNGSLRM